MAENSRPDTITFMTCALDTFREWLIAGAVTASAIFAGAIWWIARDALSPQYELIPLNMRGKFLAIRLHINNKSRKPVIIERISTKPPLAFVVSEQGHMLNASANVSGSAQQLTANDVPYDFVLASGKIDAKEFLLASPENFKSVKNVSIRLHTLTNSRVMRHRKKLLTAMLKASIRNREE